MTRRTLRSMMSGKNQPLAQYVFLIWMLGMGIIWSLIGVAEALATYWHTTLPAGLLDLPKALIQGLMLPPVL